MFDLINDSLSREQHQADDFSYVDVPQSSQLDGDGYDETTSPWNIPTVRTWEINDNSTRYDKLVAAPSNDDMVKMWLSWAGIMALVSVFTLMVFIGVLSDKTTRSKPFNLYLIYLMVPDMLMSIPCGITCFLNGLAGKFTTEFACKAQSFYFIFGIGANAWLNAVISYQLYSMLWHARHHQQYRQPTLTQVTKQSLLAYLWAMFVASWGLWDQPWWPHKTWLVNGTACVPMDYNVASTLFFYLVFFPCLMGAPMGYVAFVGYRIYKYKMLPQTGHRRILAVYFLRLAAVFVIMWLPALLFFFILGAWMGHWVLWGGGAWSHLQGGVSAAFSLLKPDITRAVINFWTCRCGQEPLPRTDSERRSYERRSRISNSSNGQGSPFLVWFKGFFTLRTATNDPVGIVNSSSKVSECIASHEVGGRKKLSRGTGSTGDNKSRKSVSWDDRVVNPHSIDSYGQSSPDSSSSTTSTNDENDVILVPNSASPSEQQRSPEIIDQYDDCDNTDNDGSTSIIDV